MLREEEFYVEVDHSLELGKQVLPRQVMREIEKQRRLGEQVCVVISDEEDQQKRLLKPPLEAVRGLVSLKRYLHKLKSIHNERGEGGGKLRKVVKLDKQQEHLQLLQER
jgi:hypothetical protein